MKNTKIAVKKIDTKKDFKHLFSPTAREPQLIEVPELFYIMADGKGDPNTAPEFAETIQALYGLAYTLKFMLKKSPDAALDFTVPPLSGLWCAEDIAAFTEGRRQEWRWTLMIMLPVEIAAERFEAARSTLAEKKPNPRIAAIRLQKYHEGRCAQIMHVGPFAEERPTIQRLHDFIAQNGLTLAGRHHEIYLSDFRRTAPEKLKTIIRQPVRPAKERG